MVRKSIAFLLALGMVLSLFAGCGGGNTADGSKETTKASNGTDAAQNANAPKDLYLFGLGAGNQAQAEDADNDKVLQYIKEKTGITIHAIKAPEQGTGEQIINVILASGSEEIDCFMADSITKLTNYIKNGALMPLNQLMDKYPTVKSNFTDDLWDTSKDKDGSIWAIPEGYIAKYPYTLMIRSDWLEKLNLQMPKTTAELEAVLKAFKENDPDGNDKDDTIPLTNWWGKEAISTIPTTMAAGFINGGYFNGRHVKGADGRLILPEMDPGYRDFVAMLADWYKKGYINPEEFATTSAQKQELAKQNRIGVAGGWHSLSYPVMGFLKNEGNTPDANYTHILEMNGPKGSIYSDQGIEGSWYVVPKKSKNSETLFEYLTWMFSDFNNYMVTRYGIPDVHWKYDGNGKYVDLQADAKKYNMGYSFITPTKQSIDEYKLLYNSGEKVAGNMYYFGQNADIFFNGQGTTLKQAADFSIYYDMDSINKEVNISDIRTYLDENFVRFVTGHSKMEEWDSFIGGLGKFKVDRYLELINSQYQANGGK